MTGGVFIMRVNGFLDMQMIQLHHGDCLEILKQIPDDSVDLVLTDPPYAVLQLKWDKLIDSEKLWQELNRITKEDGVVALFGIEPFATQMRHSNFKNYKYDWYWQKNNVAGFVNAKKRPLKIIENIMIFSKKPPRYNPQGLIRLDKKIQTKGDAKLKNKRGGDGALYSCGEKANEYVQEFTNYPKHLLQFGNLQEKDRGLHPTQKPVALLEYLIKTYTQDGETVLDFTMGSGSTGVACVNTGRKFIGIELDDHYYQVAKNRIAEAQHEPRPNPTP